MATHREVIMSYRRVGYLEQLWYMLKWWLKHRRDKDDDDDP